VFAFLVVATHAVDVSWSLFPAARAQYPWWLPNFIQYVVASGLCWVIGFFAISGYCIQLSVSRAIDGATFPLWSYLAARLSRILPLYYLGLVCAVVIEWLIAADRPFCWPNGITLRTFLGQLIMIQNLTQTFGCYTASWSITNEMFYYIFYGALVCVALKRGARATVLGLAACLAVSLPSDLMYFLWSRSRFIASLGMLFALGTIWFLGALVAEKRDALRRSPWARACSPFWPVVVAAAVLAWFSQRVHLQFVLAVLGMGFPLMLVHFLVVEEAPARGQERRASTSIVEMLGLASYPTYLFHGPLLMLTGSLLARWKFMDDWILTWIILVFVGISSGIALGYLIERPIMNWRASFLLRFKSSRSSRSPGHCGMPHRSRPAVSP
jgi:peptidoglycan/LPS O-acetylase OafA/YrhL